MTSGKWLKTRDKASSRRSSRCSRSSASVADLDLAIYVLMHSLVHAVVYDHPRHVSLERATDEIVHLIRAHLTAAPMMPQASA